MMQINSFCSLMKRSVCPGEARVYAIHLAQFILILLSIGNSGGMSCDAHLTESSFQIHAKKKERNE